MVSERHWPDCVVWEISANLAVAYFDDAENRSDYERGRDHTEAEDHVVMDSLEGDTFLACGDLHKDPRRMRDDAGVAPDDSDHHLHEDDIQQVGDTLVTLAAKAAVFRESQALDGKCVGQFLLLLVLESNLLQAMIDRPWPLLRLQRPPRLMEVRLVEYCSLENDCDPLVDSSLEVHPHHWGWPPAYLLFPPPA